MRRYPTHVLDGASQTVGEDGITLLDQGRQHQVRPLDPRAAPADPARIGLPFDGVQLLTALEAHAPGFPQQQSVGGLIGARGELLTGVTVQVLAQPGLPELIGIGMQGVFRAGRGCPGLGKERAPGRITFGERACSLEGPGLSDEADPPFGFP